MVSVERRAKIGKNTLPEFVAPCLARLGEAVPLGSEWGHEVKFDGYRMQVRVDGDDVRLLTRTGLDWTARFGTLAAAFRKIRAKSALLDGEAIVENSQGGSDFQSLVAALKSARTTPIVFVAFDLLHLDGRDIRPLALADRKAALKASLPKQTAQSRIRFSEHLIGDGSAMLREACKVGLEGIISKRLDKPYRSGRHDDWRKTKCILSDEFVIIGYLDSTAAAASVGALVLGYFDGKNLVYAGRVGTGFNRQTAASLWTSLQPLRSDPPPFIAELDGIQRRGVTWTAPRVVAQIAYRAWTADGILRHASFTALREDVPPTKVKRPQTLKQS